MLQAQDEMWWQAARQVAHSKPGAHTSHCCRQFTEDVEHVLEMLPRTEGDVVALRYGLFTGEPKSLRDVGALLKLSAEGVRKNELSAFRCVSGHVRSPLSAVKRCSMVCAWLSVRLQQPVAVSSVCLMKRVVYRRLRQVGRLQPLMSYLRETDAHGHGYPHLNQNPGLAL